MYLPDSDREESGIVPLLLADASKSAEDSDLFGTSYPWMSSASVMADGSILIGMTEERPDESADEFIVYRLTGF